MCCPACCPGPRRAPLRLLGTNPAVHVSHRYPCGRIAGLDHAAGPRTDGPSLTCFSNSFSRFRTSKGDSGLVSALTLTTLCLWQAPAREQGKLLARAHLDCATGITAASQSHLAPPRRSQSARGCSWCLCRHPASRRGPAFSLLSALQVAGRSQPQHEQTAELHSFQERKCECF